MNTEPTQIFGLIGNPVKHSLSPLIFEYLFRKYKIKACYKLSLLKFDQLGIGLQRMRILGIKGLNVTAPYKEKAIPFLDSLHESARKVKAVNVISNQRGKLVGYNTDIIGIKRTLEEKLRLNSNLEQVLLIGAGGAARACLSVLSDLRPQRVVIANRTFSRAESLKKGKKSKFRIETLELTELNQYFNKNKVALTINSASGKNSKIENVISRTLTEGGRVFDLKYYRGNNFYTRSQNYCDGLFMLACQAVESFKIWFGARPEAEEVYRYLLKKRRKRVV